MKDLKIFLLLVVLTNVALSWWDPGHMLVAKVAELDLKDRNPQAFELAENITSVLNDYSHGKIKSFVESACWPDDVKQFKLDILDPWHYINVPIRLDDSSPYPQISYSDNDCAALIKSALKTLLNWSKHEISDLNKNIFEKSMMLRYLIHVVGDIHQPLHAVQLFDNVHFKNGDLGGNFFKINYTHNVNNLHKFFDSGADSLPEEIHRPLSEKNSELLGELARSFMNEFPYDMLTINNLDVETWITESYYLAKGFIYTNVTYEGNISDEYKEASFKIVRQRISQAGFRLARLIEEVYNGYITAKKSFNTNHFLK